MGLAKTIGQESQSKVRVDDHHFILVDTSDGNYRTESLDQSAALNILRISSDVNERYKDRIRCDRRLVLDRAKSAARAQAKKGLQNYKPRPSEEAVLAEFEELIPGSGFLKLISTRMTNKKELRTFKKLIGQARKEKSQYNQILSNTIAGMQDLGKILSSKLIDSVEVDEVKEVLFYAKR